MDSNNRANKSSYSYHPSAVSPGDLLSSAEMVVEGLKRLCWHTTMISTRLTRVTLLVQQLTSSMLLPIHIEDKPFGQYIENAEGSLYQFQSSSKASVTYSDEGGRDHMTETAKQPKNPSSMYQSAPAKHASEKDDWCNKPGKHGYVASGNCFGDVDESEGGDSGCYMKLARTFLKKQGQHAGMEETEEGGFGNYMNLAQGLMKKY